MRMSLSRIVGMPREEGITSMLLPFEPSYLRAAVSGLVLRTKKGCSRCCWVS